VAGIGSHPDHLATRAAVERACPPGVAPTYYADLPYAAYPQWPRRLDGMLPRLRGRVSRHHPGGERWQPQLPGAVLRRRPGTGRLSGADAAATWRAVSCYASQLDPLHLESIDLLAREAWWPSR
jgi:hypothetical protein